MKPGFVKPGLVLASLLCGDAGITGAQAVDFTQGANNNYIVIAPADGSSDFNIRQKGKNNNALTLQSGDVNTVSVDQRGVHNASVDFQNGLYNGVNIAQEGYFKGSPFIPTTTYVGELKPYGYLSEFISGNVDILAVTGPGNTVLSSFGRGH